jgi:hypothetical protein
MKILLITALIFLFCLTAEGLTVINGDITHTVGSADLAQFNRVEIETKREKSGRIITDKWEGVLLRDVLESLQFENCDQLVFTSEDNYKIRLSAEEAGEDSVILATHRNGRENSNQMLRLVVPKMRDMFWIEGIMTIEVTEHQSLYLPDSLVFAEDLLFHTEIIDDPEPFKGVKGVFLKDLLAAAFPMMQEEFLCVGRDGVSHQLDFDQYLANAVLIVQNGGFQLRSPDMPAGMWIKDIAFIQFFDRAIIFRKQFARMSEVKEFMGWDTMPEILWTDDLNGVPTSLEFSDPLWVDIGILIWQK